MKFFLKKIYTLIPLKKQLFTTLRFLFKPKEKWYRHFTFQGVFRVKLNSDKSFQMYHFGYQLENEIFWSGLENGWEKESIKLWIKLSEMSSNIFDIGANTGVFSLISKTVNPQAQVLAFEPVESVYKKLIQNFQLNKFDIKAFPLAISNFTGTAKIFLSSEEHVYSVTVNKNLSDANVKVIEQEIKTITMNEFIKEHQIEKIDLMKIDIETHEPEFLEGFSDYLSIHKPTMLIEILNEEVGEKVNNLIKGCNYLIFNIDENKGIRQEQKITKSDYYNYLLCSPSIAHKIGLI